MQRDHKQPRLVAVLHVLPRVVAGVDERQREWVEEKAKDLAEFPD